MNKINANRIESLDLLKGLVMIIMALDHTRDYFHFSTFFIAPSDPEHTSLAIFFTRWITHFCAPAFSLLAGVSAFLVGRTKSKKELSLFLVKRGLWLILIEMTLVTFGWSFDLHFRYIFLFVIWSLGISMVALAGLIHLPRRGLLIFCLLLIFGHHLLDDISPEDNIWWAILHQFNQFELGRGRILWIGYPLIPWVGVMSLGYFIGNYYATDFDASKRRRIFNSIGLLSIFGFLILRYFNAYGSIIPWVPYPTLKQSLFSFLDPNKYPPSLTFLMMTLGPTFLFLANSEKLRGKVVDFISVYGKVPFFYYILHIYVIHFFALLLAQLTGFGWRTMVGIGWIGDVSELKGYGYSLGVVYLIWMAIVLSLYPLCRKFGKYKLSHKEKWWLSYL
jgi:uncharacterized membrane protein